jgi:hypothetical protein
MFEKMPVAIGKSLRDLASSDDGEDGEDEDEEETAWGKLTEDGEPGWVMCTFTKTLQQRMERFRHRQMKLDELTQLEWDDAADYFCQQYKKYGTSWLRVAAVIQQQMNHDAAAPLPTTFGELIENLDIVTRISQRPQGTSQPGSSHINLGSETPQSKLSIPSGEPAVEPNSSSLLNAKLVAPVSFYLCI